MLTTSEFQNMVLSGSTEKYSDEEWNQMLEYATKRKAVNGDLKRSPVRGNEKIYGA